MTAPPADSSAPRQSLWTAMAVGGIAGCLLLLIGVQLIQHAPFYDELLHVLAARGVIATGHPLIAGGEYTRAEGYTRLVAASMRIFGDTLSAARVPALISAAALVTLTGAWVTRRAGAGAGAMASLALAIMPSSMALAAMARFYALHALAILALGIAVFEASVPGRRRGRAIACYGIALGAFAVAGLLQAALLYIALPLIVTAAVVNALIDYRAAVRRWFHTHRWQAIAGTAFVVICALVVGRVSGLFVMMHQVPRWAADSSNDVNYYNRLLLSELPLLWPLVPVLALAALRTDRRIALYSGIIAIGALLIHSGVAWKADRYVYYALPWLAVLIGMGLVATANWIGSSLQRGLTRPGWAGAAATALLLCVVLGNSEEAQRAGRILLRRPRAVDLGALFAEPSWAPVLSELQESARSVNRIVTSDSMKALYYLGRYDYEMNASAVEETDSGADFGIDQKTGRPAIGSARALQRVLDMPGVTLTVIERKKLAIERGVPADAAQVLKRRCTALALPQNEDIAAWRCDTPDGSR